MNKVRAIVITIVIVIIVYLLLLVTMPVVSDLASTSNTTMAATSNLTNYPGAAEGVLAAPWVLYFVPGAIGLVVIVFILKGD